jgi:hypothetical protein
MTVMTTWEAVPNRLYSLYASLVDLPAGEDRERFEALSTPASLRNKSEEEEVVPTNLFSNALREAIGVGLIEVDEGKIRVTEQARVYAKSAPSKEVAFRRFMADILLDEVKAAATQQSGFLATLAWFLTKSPFKPANFKADPTSELKADLGEKLSETGVSVIADYQNFLYWARFLGFATILGGRDTDASRDGRYVIPDPFNAIRVVIPAIMGDQTELGIEQFVARLSAILPVFEGGKVRREMIRSPEADRDGSAGSKLSQATSLALQRLESGQYLQFRRDADAPMIMLDLCRTERRISHVTRSIAA